MNEQEIEKIKKEAIKEFQSKGGQTTSTKYGKEHYSNAGKKGMEKRWKDKKKLST